MHPARLVPNDLLKDCRRENTRASGPGGQHRNRVATAVRLTHTLTGLMGQANERRSQQANAEVALFRLRLNLAMEFRPQPTDLQLENLHRPSPAWESRRRRTTIRVNGEHKDFPALLAEVLDLLHWREDDLPKVAAELQVSKSQLVRFLGIEPRALANLNQRRKQAGLSPLR